MRKIIRSNGGKIPLSYDYVIASEKTTTNIIDLENIHLTTSGTSTSALAASNSTEELTTDQNLIHHDREADVNEVTDGMLKTDLSGKN
jgi:hypothetical protein